MALLNKAPSILTKLGLKGIGQMTDDELRSLVSLDRQNRTLVRAAGRIKRIAKDKSAVKVHRSNTLEALGLDKALIEKWRSSGKSDEELISILKAKGIL